MHENVVSRIEVVASVVYIPGRCVALVVGIVIITMLCLILLEGSEILLLNFHELFMRKLQRLAQQFSIQGYEIPVSWRV